MQDFLPKQFDNTSSIQTSELQTSGNQVTGSKLARLVAFIRQRKPVVLGLFAVLVFTLGGIWILSKKGLPSLPTIKPKPVQVLAKDLRMEALAKDSIGVAPGSAYVISSSEALSAGLVKKALAVSPEFDFETEQVSENEVKIFPKGELAENTVYQFTLTNETEAIQDDPSWAFQIKNPFRIINTLPRNEATNVPIDSGIEITFSHENHQDIDNFFTIFPQVAGRFERHKRTTVFVSKGLQHSTVYTVTIKKGLGLTGSDEKLGEDYVFQFETEPQKDSKPTYLSFSREFFEFPAKELPALGLYAYELPENLELPFEVFQYQSQEAFLAALKEKGTLPLWARNSREAYLYPTDGLNKAAEFKAPLQKGDFQDYVIFPESLPNGYYLIQTEYDGRKKQSLLQITDVASFLTTSNTKSLVWVNDVSSGQAVAGATVKLIDSNLQQQTDNSGIAYFDTPEELKDAKKRYYFTITTPDGKSAVVPVIQDYGISYYYNYLDRKYTAKEDYWSYLYLDRPVYLPNDKISFWGIVKNRDKPNERSTLTIKLTESQYYYSYNQEEVSIFEKEVTVNDFGTFHDEIPLQNLKPGSYQVQILVDDTVLTSSWLSVEDYVKPAYQISVEAEKKAVFAGETVNLKGKTAFFEGTAVPNVTLNYTGKYNYTGDNEGELTSDQYGEFILPYTPTYINSENTRYPISEQFQFTPKLAEEGEIIGSAQLQVFGPRIDLSAKGSVEGETKAKVEMTVKEVALDRLNNGSAENDNDYLGNPVNGQKVDGKIYVTHWEKQEIGDYYDFINKKVQKKYKYNYVRDFFKDFSVTTENNGQVVYTFDIEQEKSYEIKLAAKDVNGRTARNTVYVYGSRYASGGTNYQRYQLVTTNSADAYSLGDKVSLAIKKGEEISPAESAPRYLFLKAQRGTREYSLKQESTYEFLFAEEHIPNILAKAVYFDGRTYFQTSSLNLKYRKEDKELSIEVQMDKESYEPADEVKLDVFVKAKDGKGQVSEVNLSLVDEALFALQGQYVDTLGSLYTNVGSGIIQTYASHQYPLDIGAEGGGACFLQGTAVKMADGSEQGIEEVKVGDFISTRKSEFRNEIVSAKVTKVDKHIVNHILLVNDSLWVTPEHRVLINGQWQEIGLAQIGDFLLNESDKQVPITSIEQKYGAFRVYNLEVEMFKTYFADGFYVHNIKGREYFADKAFFGVVRTDSSGHGEATFKLPDNLTSWRITYQGVTADLKSGNGKKLLPVCLPFFVDAGLNKQYLANDEPIVKIRSFGEKLQVGQEVEYKIKISSLGVDRPQTLQGKAFEAIEYNLPKLTAGEHKIEITGKAGSLQDKLIRSFRVYDSYLVKTDAEFGKLDSATKIENPNNLPITLVFSDQNRGRFYPILTSLLYTYGDRVDQRLAKVKSAQLLKDYFEEEVYLDESFDGAMYQVAADGGIALFPYSGSEVDLSAKIAALAADEFDKAALRQYFLKIVDDKNTGAEQTAIALYGLAALGEPVLVPIQQLNQGEDLSVIVKLYLALGMSKLGDKQTAREIYKTLVEQYGEETPPYLRLNVGVDQDDIVQATTLAAQLAGLLAEDVQDSLYKYVNENYTTDILIYLERLAYAEYALPLTNPEAVSFTYELDGQTQTRSLQKGQTFKLVVAPGQAEKIKFTSVQGQVGLTQLTQVPLNPDNIEKSPYVSISRMYTVNGRQQQNFKEADLIKVQLTYKLGQKAFDGCYQVTDYLPSGLRPIANLSSRGIKDSEVWYPYEVNGQKVSFCTYRKSRQEPIIYYARVISKGKYLGESAIIQSQKSPTDLNLSQQTEVSIQ